MGKVGTLYLNIYLSLLHFNFNIIFFLQLWGIIKQGYRCKGDVICKILYGLHKHCFRFNKCRLNTIRVTEFMGMVLVAFKTYGRDIDTHIYSLTWPASIKFI